MRSQITTHILDIARGCPAAGVEVGLEVEQPDASWKAIAAGRTDADGRIENFPGSTPPLQAGTYRLIFLVGPYFEAQQCKSFYPQVVVIFTLSDPDQHYHVPLLLSPYGYSTYRGS